MRWRQTVPRLRMVPFWQQGLDPPSTHSHPGSSRHAYFVDLGPPQHRASSTRPTSHSSAPSTSPSPQIASSSLGCVRAVPSPKDAFCEEKSVTKVTSFSRHAGLSAVPYLPSIKARISSRDCWENWIAVPVGSASAVANIRFLTPFALRSWSMPKLWPSSCATMRAVSSSENERTCSMADDASGLHMPLTHATPSVPAAKSRCESKWALSIWDPLNTCRSTSLLACT
mmetsp:Transcript_14201/g.42952  ORF Transcript_14201/g.42952 Transcript_14201/m.42952 type:complete len:227 (-) Transcript_14201:1090-1770(-)